MTSFRSTLWDMWFEPYERSSSNELGSSGFEHIYIGEIKGGVSGFHSWFHFAYEESRGNADYYGHLGLDQVVTFAVSKENRLSKHTCSHIPSIVHATCGIITDGL